MSSKNNKVTDFLNQEDNILELKNISKNYQIYNSPEDRLKQSILPKIGKLIKKIPKNYFKDFWALKNISFNVRKGETLGIIGKNGSGKSTLLQIITGTLSPSSGEVNVQGRIAALLELGSGFNPEFTGKENVFLNATVLGLKKDEINSKYSLIEKFAEIGEFINQPVKTYSSGMMLRLAFSVAIHSEPDILIIDEALAVGDFYFQQKCFKRLRELKDRGVSLILVSHDSASIIQLCDTAVFLSEGEIRYKGIPKDTVSTYIASLNMPKVELSVENKRNNISKKLNSIYKINSSANIYGSKEVEIIDWGIIDSLEEPITVLPNDKDLTLVIKAEFNKDCIDPIFGYFFTDSKGRQIVGTNTTYLKSDCGFRKSGEILEIRFTQKFLLANGEYSLNLGCSEYTDDGLIAHHRLYDISVLTFTSENDCVGFFHPVTNLDIKKIN